MATTIGRPPLPIHPGDRFGRLTVIKLGPPSKSKDRRFWCTCSCNRRSVLVPASALKRGNTRSCGCLHSETIAEIQRTHGYSGTPEHKCWMAIRQRCSNPSDHSYPDYGGRGIRVCERWQDFEAFLADMGPRPSPRHSIERLDVDGDYSPDNCIWADPVTQARNKRCSRYLEWNGERLHLQEWAQRTGIPTATIKHRLDKRNWSIERALTTPPEIYKDGTVLTFQGKTQPLRAWAQELGIKPGTLHYRLHVAGWSTERALSTPTKKPGQ